MCTTWPPLLNLLVGAEKLKLFGSLVCLQFVGLSFYLFFIRFVCLFVCWCPFAAVFLTIAIVVPVFPPPLYQHCTAGRKKRYLSSATFASSSSSLKTYYAIPAAACLNDLLSIAYRDRRTLLSTGDRSLPSFGTAAIV